MIEIIIKSKFLWMLFLILSGIFCETIILPELQTILEEAYYNVTCIIKNIDNFQNCTSTTRLHFRNDTKPMVVDWLCRDEDILSFNWTSNNSSMYVIEFRNNYNDWTYYEQTMQNIVVLKYLDYDEEYQIRVWKVSPDGSVEGPFLSDIVKTFHPADYPLRVPEFRLINWEYQDGSSFFANVEWTPSEDRLCFYSIRSDDDKIIHVTDDFSDVFKEKIPGFCSGVSYALGIAPKLINSVPRTDGTYLVVNTPNCMELYKSVDKCVPIIPANVQFYETISKYYEYPSENLTYDINITWSAPEYQPDNYTISIIILEQDRPPVTQNARGNATNLIFYNMTLTPYYTVSFMMSSKAGHKKRSFDGMFTNHPKSFQTPNKPISTIFIIICAVAAISLSVIFLIFFFSYKRYERSKIINKSHENSFTYLQPIHHRQFCIADDEWKLNAEDIEVGDIIGEGVFGVVYQGRRKNENVAIKMLKGNYTSDEVRQFENEIDIMKSVGFHSNVVSLIGFCIKPEYSCPLLVVEYCEMGNLQAHLRSLWTAITTTYYNNREYANCSTIEFANLEYEFPEIVDLSRNLLSYAHQVASGMEHLANCKVVHRDLATRNILMCSNKLVKIADFGLSRDVYLDNIYTKEGSGVLPVKWMAIESLTHQVFSTKSDVWSFGVFLWEIATFGEYPYSVVPHEQLLTYLLNGHRLNCPESCHTTIYQIMLKCWKHNPQERPTFTELVQNLENLLQSNDQYLFIRRSKFNNQEEFFF